VVVLVIAVASIAWYYVLLVDWLQQVLHLLQAAAAGITSSTTPAMLSLYRSLLSLLCCRWVDSVSNHFHRASSGIKGAYTYP
jgi:hypothetical protein